MLRFRPRHSWLYLVRNTTILPPHFSINHTIKQQRQVEEEEEQLEDQADDAVFSYEDIDDDTGILFADVKAYDEKIHYDQLIQEELEEAQVHPADSQLIRDMVQDELDKKDPDNGLKTTRQLLNDYLVSSKQDEQDEYLDTSSIDPRLLQISQSELGAEELLQDEKLTVTESALASTLFNLQEKNKLLGLFVKQQGSRVGDPQSVQKDFAKIGNSITDQLSLAQRDVNLMRNSSNLNTSKYQSNLRETLEWADVDSFYRRNEMIYDDIKKKENENITKFFKQEQDTYHLSQKERQLRLIEQHGLQEEFYKQMLKDEKEGVSTNATTFILNKFDQHTVEPWDHSQVEQYKRRKELQRENQTLKLATAHIIHDGVSTNPLAFLQYPPTEQQHPLYGNLQQKIAQFYANEEMKTQIHGIAAENPTLDSFPIDRVTLLKSLLGDMTVHQTLPTTKDPAVEMEKELKKQVEDAVDTDVSLTNYDALRQLWIQVLHLSMPNPSTALDPQQRQQQLQQRIKVEDIKSKDDFFEKIKYILPREKISNDKALNEKYLREEIIQKRLKRLFPSLEYNVLHTIFERILNLICNANTPLQNQGKVDAASMVETPRNSPAYWAINQLTQVVLNQNEKKYSQQSQEKSFFFKLTEMASQPRPILAAIQESFEKFGRGKVKEREFMAVIERLKMKDPSTSSQPYQALYEILTPIHKQREEEKSNVAQKKDREPKIINGFAIGTAKRKSSRAYAKITPGNGLFTINGKDYLSYLTNPFAKHQILNILSLVNVTREFDIQVTVRGGGITGQTDAITLAITNAISNFIPEFAHFYAKYGYLTKDPRVVERKKPGKKKARRSFQWVKR